MLISQHGDGRIAAEAISHFSFRSVAGSSSLGGVAVLSKLEKLFESGEHFASTPDGLRGPRLKAKIGAVALASKCQSRVLPVALQSNTF